jgi:RNase H-like domain found in reverse transcriptase
LDALIKKVTTMPVLKCPDPEKQYFLEVDASAFTLGAVLFQKDEVRRRCDITYFSKALTPPEQNYNIWDQRFLAVVAALRNWRHLLIGT